MGDDEKINISINIAAYSKNDARELFQKAIDALDGPGHKLVSNIGCAQIDMWRWE